MLNAGELVRAAPRHGKIVLVFDVEAPGHLEGALVDPSALPDALMLAERWHDPRLPTGEWWRALLDTKKVGVKADQWVLALP